MPSGHLRSTQTGGGRPTRNLYAAALAVLVSALFHALLIRHCPSFFLGRASDLAVLKRAHSVVLDKVLPDYRPEQPKTENRVRPENPEKWSAAMLQEASLPPAQQAGVEPAPWEHQPKTPAPEKAPVKEWNARQQVMTVEERIYADEVSALPRRFADEVPRTYDAADMFALEAESMPDASALPAGAGPQMEMPLPAMPFSAGTALEAPAVPFAAKGLSETLLNEPVSEITDMEPVEDLLALNISVYRPNDEEWLYFQIGIEQKAPDALPVLPKQLIFLQDCSESMTPEKVEQCKNGLLQSIDRLSPRDAFNIAAFREDVSFCYPAPVAVTPLSQARARWFINDMQSLGNTDVYAPLQQVLAQSAAASNPVVAVLITDGRPTSGMVDTSEIIHKFTQGNKGLVSVFTVGGGQRANRMLLDFLSYKNRGDAHVVADSAKIPDAMTGLLREISRPVLTELGYQCAPVDEKEIYPATLTHLYLDRPLMLYGRCRPDTQEIMLQITGSARGRDYDMVFPLQWDAAEEGGAALRSQWVWHRIYDLMGRYIRDKNPEILSEMQSWASQYGLVIPYSFGSEEYRKF
ncbi:MAG: VWA domain-containing protein [Kiritimatiellia bacterium]